MEMIHDSNRALAEFLKPEIRAGWGLSRDSFTNPTWNILLRVLYKAKLLAPSGVIDTILVSSLFEVSVSDVRDFPNVGNKRLMDLLKELSSVETPVYEPLTIEPLNEDNGHLSIEQWVLIRILKQSDWRKEFLDTFGYQFDENVFEDEAIQRRLKVLELRMSGATLDAIGKQFGVSRERIRQIVKKAFKKVEGDPSLNNMDISEILLEKTQSVKNEIKRFEQSRKNFIDAEVRKFLNTKPGASIEELCEKLGFNYGELTNSLQPQTTKFIWTEVRENINESPYSDEAILEALKLAEAFESPISAPMYRHLVESGLVNGPGPQTVATRFGSWKRACELAEVTYNESVRAHYEKLWTEDEMLSYIVEFLRDEAFGKGIQSYDEWRIETMTNAPSGALVRKQFETWSNTKNKALLFMRDKNLDCNL